MRKRWKIVGGVLVLAVVAIQFKRPARENPPVNPSLTLDAVAKPPADVAKILAEACYDCHTNSSRWPWYSHVAPVSWLIAEDVEEARLHVNFSEFGEAPPEDQADYLRECAKEVLHKGMPLKSYTWLHSAARLSDADRSHLADWFEQTAQRLGGIEAGPESRRSGNGGRR